MRSKTSNDSIMNRMCVLVSAILFISGCATQAGAVDDTLPDRHVWTIGPLEQYLARISNSPQFGSGSERQAAIESAHLEAEELIASCMLAQGFDYVINADSGILVIDRDEIEFAVPYGSRLWAERYGFGSSHPALNPPPPPFDEPHHAAGLLNEMTQTEQDEWFSALYGEDADDPWDGCFGQAQATLWWNWQIPDANEFKWLILEMSDVWASTHDSTNPAFNELNAEWQTCMIQTGLDLIGSHSPTELRWNLLWEYNNVMAGIAGGWLTTSVLEDQENREVDLAVANWDCIQYLNFENRHRDIQLLIEQDYIERRGTLLEEVALSLETK